MSTQTNSVTSKKSELLFNEIIEVTEEEAHKIVGGSNSQPAQTIFSLSQSQMLTSRGILW